MANPYGQQSVFCEAFLGLITNAAPEALPEGASPLNWDVDYLIGSVFTRPGLVSSYTLTGGFTGNPFFYIKSYALTDGELRTLALDNSGQLWTENVVTSPGVLSTLTPKVLSGSHAFSVTQDDVEYVCFGDLSQGVDIPRQYNVHPSSGSYSLDRVSQVGPGAPPSFQANITPAGSQATITSWVGAAGIVTFQAVNTFTAGEVVTLSGFPTSVFFNGVVAEVLGTGLSGTQFKIANSKVGSATETGTASPQFFYPISSITQFSVQSDPQDPGFLQALLWSSGPGTTAAGSVVTVYYARSAFPDNNLINTFNLGIPTYVFISGAPFGNGTQLVTGIGNGIPPSGAANRAYFTYTANQVNSVYYGGAGIGGTEPPGQYQQTLAKVVLKVPFSQLQQGQPVIVEQATPSAWNGSWNVVSVLNSGVYLITQTSLTAGTATYNWTWAGVGVAIAPAARQLVTIINCTNGNGVFNVTDALIQTVTGGPTSGSFTITGFNPPDVTSAPENGQAQTIGSQFYIDPGVLSLGTPASNPIFGNDNATGAVVVTGSNAIASGTRQAVCFFETRSGYKTACSAPITFTTNSVAATITATSIPIGPPNVIRRWIAFTVAGQNGVPGPNFYAIDAPVSYSSNGQTFLYTPTFIDDNITTTASFIFTDAVLLAGEEIDVQGNNLFEEIELGASAWNVAYASRMFYGLEQNKVLNFTNLTFDGGYLPVAGGGNLLPLGWKFDNVINTSSNAAIVASNVFGNAYYISNNNLQPISQIQTLNVGGGAGIIIVTVPFAADISNLGRTVTLSGLTNASFLNGISFGINAVGVNTFTSLPILGLANYGPAADTGNIAGLIVPSGTQTNFGMITQTAYQDAFNVPIILPNTLYSVRVYASIPSGMTSGTLVVDLTQSNAGLASGTGTATGYGITYGSFSLPFASMTTTPAIFTGTLLTTPFSLVPPSLVLRVWAQNIAAGADVQVERIEIFPTFTPLLSTNVRVSYVDNFEAFDAITGNIGLASHDTNACFGAAIIHDQLYFLQSASMQSTQDVPGIEPSGPGGGWPVHEVSNRVGACGIYAYDYGEEWLLTACRNGIFGFNGGQPIRIDFQQKELWELINWKYGNTIIVRNDMLNRRILAAVPLPTPNPWLPLAPVNANPTSPNVILMWNYHGLGDFQELINGRAVHTTMFGVLAAVDMRLKASIWQIPTNYMGFVKQADLTTLALVISGASSGAGRLYKLSLSQFSDQTAGADSAINSTYCTYGFVNSAKAAQNPLLGFHRKRYSEVQSYIRGSGQATIQAFPNYVVKQDGVTLNPSVYTTPPIALQTDPPDDIVRPLNISGNRVYVMYSTNAVGAAFNLSKTIMVGILDPFSTVNPNSG